MSEIKRIQLTTISDVKKSNDQVNLSPSKTARFEINVDLFEPNADSFPEFNFRKLLHAEKKKHKKHTKSSNGFSDPFEENEEDDDVARIAKEFEKKYGGSNYVTSKKKHRPNVDCYDKGAGYDDNDSFIDNTEAYDEIIPEEIETVGGGFYINSGALEFKHLSNFERPEDAQKMPKPKKRALSTSSESSDDDEEEESESDTENINSSKSKNGHSEKKQKVLNNVEEKDSKIESNQTTSKDNDKKIKKDKTKDVLSGNDSGKERETKPIKTTTVKDMLRAKRDSLLNAKEGGVKSDTTPSNTDKESNEMEHESTSSSLTSDSSNQGTSDQAEGKESEEKNELKKENGEIVLPPNLSENLIYNINKLKDLAQNSSGNFGDNIVCDLLLRIDNEARNSGSIARSQIYTYLESFLPYTRSTLLTKLKKLRIQQEDNKIIKTVNKLKLIIDDIMPNTIRNYEEECQKVNELRSRLSQEEKVANTIKTPKKRFQWSDCGRSLLYEIYSIRKNSFDILKPRKETLEEFIDNFFKVKLINLWPQGWMKLEELNREIEKKKLNMKKTKENKKPHDISNSKDKQQQQPSINANVTNEPSVKNINTNVSPTPSNSSKDSNNKNILATSNSLLKSSQLDKSNQRSGNSTNCVKNGKTEQYDVKKNSNSSSGFNNSLTITPVTSTTSASTNKPLPNVENKVTITNVDQNIPLPLSSSPVLKEVAKNSKHNVNSANNMTQNSKNTNLAQVVPKLPSSLSISIQQNSVSNTNVTNTAKETNISPPSRKTSDYSINSIMSTPSISSQTNHVNAGHSNFSSKNSSSEDLYHNNNNISSKNDKLDRYKHEHSTSSGGGNLSSNVHKENSIKSKNNLNNSNNNHNEKLSNSPKNLQKVLHISDDDDDDSNSSDCVEIVDVFSPKKKSNKPSASQQNINKNRSSESSHSNKMFNESNEKLETNHMNYKLSNSKKEDLIKLPSSNFSTDTDLDVLQIMKDLKELQELQQPKYSTANSIENQLSVKSAQHASSYIKGSKEHLDPNMFLP